MAERDDPNLAEYQEILARLDKATALVRRREAAADEARSEAGEIAVEGIRAGLKAGRKRTRTEVLNHSPFSHTTLRDLAEAAGIPPDGRYVRTAKAAERSPAPREQPAESWAQASDLAPPKPPVLPARVQRIPPPEAERLARLAEDRAGEDWRIETLTADGPVHPNFTAYVLVAAALESDILKDSEIPEF